MKVWATSNSGPGTKTKYKAYHCIKYIYVSKSILDCFKISSSDLRLRQVQTMSPGSRYERKLGKGAKKNN